ncbi:hypothetical protein HA402_013117 [Bradysia odoriphaga]|nr:hypothetical protein HA402_013117 [Bradysia odoriphaga]
MKAVITLLVALLAVQNCSAFINILKNYPPPAATCPAWMDHKYSRAIIPFCFPNGYPYTTVPKCGCYDFVSGCHTQLDVPCLPPILPHPCGTGLVVVPPCDWRQRYVVIY